MCGGASYHHNGDHMRVYFPNPKAKLPVIAKDNQTKLVLWGTVAVILVLVLMAIFLL